MANRLDRNQRQQRRIVSLLPVDRSVLYLTERHIAMHIWNGNVRLIIWLFVD